MRTVSRSVLPALLIVLVAASVAAGETVPLGDFRFDSRLFGDTMTPATPPLLLAAPWLNITNADPGPGNYLTGSNFNTGINLGAGPIFTIGYNTPIINGPGQDFGIITAPLRFPGEPVASGISVGTSQGRVYDPLQLGVDTGVTKAYFFQDQLDATKSSGPITRPLYVTPVDLSDFGIAEGEGIQSIRIGSTNGGVLGGPSLATIRIAGFDRTDSVAVPELAILHVFGPQLHALLNPRLQHLTAWGATAILRAIRIPAVQRGVYVDLPSVSLEVQEWCSGLYSMKWLLLLALFIALVGSGSLPWKVALIVVAPLIALEANMLRVAGIGLSVELVGRHAYKDAMAWAALALGVVQVVGLGRLMNRRARTA